MAISMDDIKNMSPQIKALIAGLAMLLIGYLFWFLYFGAALEKRSTLSKNLVDIQQQITEKDAIAKQKQKFINEIAALKELLSIALTKLPEQREIPGLFLAVAEAGKDAGIEFILFEPKAPEKPPVTKVDVKASLKPSDQRAAQPPPPPAKDQKPAADAKATPAAAQKAAEPEKFFEEIPVRVTVNGGFLNTAVFFDKVARLPRIVNIQDIAMGEGKDVKGRGRLLNTSCIIKTYMFLDKKKDEKAK